MPPLSFNALTAEEAAEIRRRKAAISRRIRKEVLAEFGIDKLPTSGQLSGPCPVCAVSSF